MNNVDKFLDRLKTFKPLIDDGKIPKKSFDATRSYLELPHFNRYDCTYTSLAATDACHLLYNAVDTCIPAHTCAGLSPKESHPNELDCVCLGHCTLHLSGSGYSAAQRLLVLLRKEQPVKHSSEV